ncbi:peptidoglycan endopeptidase [Shimia sp. R9_2]|uniref:NlpC/P60 family protein n=1 Tax=Shimia sp. R9_2 TaxID=2821112 RepID=UPI001ADD0227|nr:NlpC/P60 family protein [Shimia sp. R9_2]MBO9398729.1 peptidoglycan endopeptidase [Shimia sp. R9_2]
MWTDDWIGIPYQDLGRGPDSYDCLGLFVELQRVQHDREIYDPLCSVGEAARYEIAEQSKPLWREVSEAQAGDALLFRVRGRPLHIGYAVSARLMLHTSAQSGGSVLEDFTTSKWGANLEGIYRYVG